MSSSDTPPTGTILLNGRSHPLAGPMTVLALLDSLGMAGKPVVVELDQEAVLPAHHGSVRILPGARVEIVALAAGG